MYTNIQQKCRVSYFCPELGDFEIHYKMQSKITNL